MAQVARKYQVPLPSPTEEGLKEVPPQDLPDDWYLLPYRTASPKLMPNWWRQALVAALVVASAAGLLTCWIQYHGQVETADELNKVVQHAAPPANSVTRAGSGSASVSPSSLNAVKDQRPKAEALTAKHSALSSEDAARLEARNRRLEALVKVLRHRSLVEKSAAPSTPSSRR